MSSNSKKRNRQKSAGSSKKIASNRKNHIWRKKEYSGMLIVVSIFAFFLLIIFAALLLGQKSPQTSDFIKTPQPPPASAKTMPVKVYFLNTATGKPETEERTIADGSYKDVIESLLNELRAGPKSPTLSKTIPDDIEIKINLYEPDELAEVQLSENYKKLSLTDELFCRVSLVMTLTELDFIKNVHIYVGNEELLKSDGEAVGLLNRDNVKVDSEVPPVMTEEQDFTVYFSDEQALGLVGEVCKIQVDPNQQVEKYIVEQIINGPESGSLFRTVPAETKILDVKTEDNICYVDLSSDFITKFEGGYASERLAVYSIVNSLTELPRVKKVQILVDGIKVPTINGHMDTSSPFERNEEIISE